METEGQRPPRASANSKNVSISVISFLVAPGLGFLPDEPEDFDDEDEVVMAPAAAAEEVLLDTTTACEVAFPPDLPPFPPFPLFPVEVAVEFENGAIVADATDALVEASFATLEEELDETPALLSATSGPATTALAASHRVSIAI